jgi:RNA polymerase sigma factor (sigma-70 family)
MSDENEVYRKWIEAPGGGFAGGELETKLASRVARHARAVVWEKLKEDQPELVQDVASAVMTRLRDFRSDRGCKFSTWVHGIAKRKVYEEIRRRRRERKVFDKTIEVVPESRIELDGESSNQLREVVPTTPPNSDAIVFGQFFATLPRKDAALLRYKYEGLTSKEIAEKMGTGIDAVDCRWARLKQKAKKEFCRQ